MKVELKETEKKNKLRLSLEVPAEHAQQEYSKACRRLGQRVNIPGFRRGKAPFRLIERHVGPERIKQEALERILPHAFADVISEHQLDLVAPPSVEKFTFDVGQPVTVQALLELRPEVQLPDFSSLVVKVPEYKAEDDQLDKELNVLLERKTTFEEVSDRPSEATDIATIDFNGFVEGAPIEGGSAKGYDLDLANSPFLEGFAEQLVGKKIGDPVNVTVTFPEDYHEKSLAGKEATFDVTIQKLQKRVVPELNDEFAKSVGAYETLDELKAAIQKAIDAGVEREQTERKRRAALQTVVKEASVELPEALVQRETQTLVEETKERFKSQKLSWEEFIEGQGQESIISTLQQEATTRVKTSFVFGAIARKENITVADEEFSEQVRHLAEHRQVDEKVIMRQLASNPSAIQGLTDQLLAQKVMDYLVDTLKFELVDEEAYIGELSDEIDAEALVPHVHGPGCSHDHDHEHSHASEAAKAPDSGDVPSSEEKVES